MSERYTRRLGAGLAAVTLLFVATPDSVRAEPPVVGIVQVKAPWWAPDFLIERRFADSIPRYRAAPGLARKFYILSDRGTLGGIYLWRDRAAAEAFYDPAWHADLTERYGAPPDLVVFESSVQRQGPGISARATETGRDYVALFVPAGAEGPSPESTPGLLYHYARGPDEDGAGVYLFASQEAAETFLAAGGSGPDEDIQRFDVSVVLDNTIAGAAATDNR